MALTFVTSEAPTCGHPDKLADQIADGIVDQILSQDADGRCGCEVLVNAEVLVVAGEVKTTAQLDIPTVVEQVIADAGYGRGDYGFSTQIARLITAIREQSPEISAVIERPKGTRAASDQGVVYGYACDETDVLMPLPIQVAHDLVRRLDHVRQNGPLHYLRPDGKSQVTVEYDDGEPQRISTLVLAAQHDPDIGYERICADLHDHVIVPVVPAALLQGTHVVINRLERFVLGGPLIDTGVTGRKLVCDTYGAVGKVGGGALSGKDPTKLDRSGAYFGRHIAKSIVASGLARRCEVEIAFAFGEIDAVNTTITTFGTSTLDEAELITLVGTTFAFSVEGVIDSLDLRRPIYGPTARYGHFGDPAFPWEVVRPLRDSQL